MAENSETAEGNGWPADHVERRDVDELIPYARNARTHSDAQVSKLAASMREWGWTVPVLLDEHNGIIAGHGRILAARRLGITQVPCMVARGWSDAQKRAYVVADNKLTLEADWDNDMLAAELQEIAQDGFNVELTGFDQSEVDELLAQSPDGSEGEDSDENDDQGGISGALSDRFGVPPFTVLNAREGWWQARKQGWLDLGIQSELGRGDDTNTLGAVPPNEGSIKDRQGSYRQNSTPEQVGRPGEGKGLANAVAGKGKRGQ